MKFMQQTAFMLSGMLFFGAINAMDSNNKREISYNSKLTYKLSYNTKATYNVEARASQLEKREEIGNIAQDIVNKLLQPITKLVVQHSNIIVAFPKDGPAITLSLKVLITHILPDLRFITQTPFRADICKERGPVRG